MKFTKKLTLVFMSVFLLTFIFYNFNFRLSLLSNDHFTLQTTQVQAVKQTGSKKIGNKFGANTDIQGIIVGIIKTFLTFLTIIFIILILIAGFKWMTAAGNEEQIKEARSQLSHAIIGLIIILSAYAITHFVFDVLIESTTGTDPIGPHGWDWDEGWF